MPADARRRARPRLDPASTLALGLALVAATLPLLGVIRFGGWVGLSVLLLALILGVGALLRRALVPAPFVALAEALVAVCFCTAVFLPADAALLLVPTASTLDEAGALVQTAAQEIATEVAPMRAGAALTFVLVAAVGAVTVALDHVVLTARMPLLGGVALVSIWIIPSLVTRSQASPLSFILMAAAILLLIRLQTRHGNGVPSPHATRTASGVGLVAAVVGAVAISGSLLATPTLRAPAGGVASGTTIDATLNLGDDLRRPSERRVLTYRTDAATPPYLRVATLTTFQGQVWRPDRMRTVALGDGILEPVEVGEDIPLEEVVTNVEIEDLASGLLPVPYPATALEGVRGEWRFGPFGRVLSSAETTAQGQAYRVTTTVPRPSREQIQAAPAEPAATIESASIVPFDTPEEIAATAREVTAEATNDYDRLVAMQAWFRGSTFRYSLDSPVELDFDGAGVDAIRAFLEVRSGYCVHYASAFALMARTLDMPSRIAVGFLPGSDTNERIDGQPVYEATTAQLHAWPEVHFAGIGWVAFEPTKSLGTPTRFAPESPTDDGEVDEGPTPSTAPTPTPSAPGAVRDDEVDDTAAASGRPPLIDVAPLLPVLIPLAALLVAPAALRALRAVVWRRRAQAGSPAAAWRMLQDAAIDLGAPVPASESPRAFGERAVAELGAPEPETARLVDAIERRSFAPTTAQAADGPALARDADAARRAMLRAAPRRTRTLARLFPRSLAVRPGTTLAENDALLRV